MQYVYVYKEGSCDNAEGENVTYVFADHDVAQAYLRQQITKQFGYDYNEIRRKLISDPEYSDYADLLDDCVFIDDCWWRIDKAPVRLTANDSY